jgi:M6 family metalloprotease-like protein
MRTLARPFLACAAVALAAAASSHASAGDGIGPSLLVTGPTGVGDVVVVLPPETAPVSGPIADWRPVPGLSGAIQSASGANLTITVTAEMFGQAGALVRARVDGTVLASEPMFVAATQGKDDVRAYTFVASGVPLGQHTVEIEWKTALPNVAPQMRDRSLTMHSAQPASGSGRLVVGEGTSKFDVNTTSYTVVPGTAVKTTTAQAGPLAITFSGDVTVVSGRLFAQAIVDGKMVSDVLVAEGGASRGARSYTMVTPSVAAGAHDVEIRARMEGGAAQINARSVAVASAPATSADGGMVALGLETPPVPVTSTSFVDVPGLTADVTTSAGASTFVVDTGAQMYVTGGRLFVRALVDGVPVKPGDVTFLQGEPKQRAESFAFGIDNVLPGKHTVKIQAKVDASTTTAFMADRFLRVHHARRSGASFAAPTYLSMRPRTKKYETLVICFDPKRPAHTKPTKKQLVEQFEGTDGGASIRAWWAENSGGRITSGNVRYVGCDDSGWLKPPAGREGDWYWNNNAFMQMWQDALAAADASVDFHALDTNKDNMISPEETFIAIVRPQNDPYGTTQPVVSAKLDGVATALNIHVSDIYLSSKSANRTWGVGLMAHEFSHSLLDTQDLYSPCPADTDAHTFSIMSNHRNGTHLDPFHKLKSGLVAADAINLATWTTQTLSLAAIETGRTVLLVYDPTKADKEYFLVENRFGGSGRTANYDDSLTNSVVVWHVIEDATTRNTFPNVPPKTLCRIPVRFIKSLTTNGASQDLTWANGTAAKMRVVVKSAPGATTKVEIAKLP